MSPELRDALAGLSQRQCEVGKVITVACKELTAERESSIVQAHVFLHFVGFKGNHSLQNVLGCFKHEHFFFRKADALGLDQLREVVVEFAFLRNRNVKVSICKSLTTTLSPCELLRIPTKKSIVDFCAFFFNFKS